MRPAPSVTGISPAEGPPGERVIIRGENLGINAKDVIGLTICGANCLLSADYKSPSKIIARTGPSKPGKGDIIVMTRSGGVGSCTIQFKSLAVLADPLRESAVWIEEAEAEELVTSSGSTRPVSPPIHQDPLGIASDVFGYQIPEDKLEDLYPEGSGNILAENFNPDWFLLEKHSDTRFDTLRNGLRYFKHEESRRATGPLAFVKENLETFLDALDTLSDVQKKMLKDESVCEGGSIAETLESILQGASKNADALFQDVLNRKDDADRTRNALNVLQRFRFLFSLPQSIERNIQQGDYEMVISDYARAKSLFAETDIKIFKKVSQEVDLKIEGFRTYLKSKLLDFPSPLEEQKRVIRYLVELDVTDDPAWTCLVNQHTWLTKLLTSCRDDHQRKDAAPLLQVDAGGMLDVDALSKKAAMPVHFRSEGFKDSSSLGTQGLGGKATSMDRQHRGSVMSTPQRVKFVEELSELVTESVPDLWRLGQAYFGNMLMGEGIGSTAKQLSPSQENEVKFKSMVEDVTSLYTDLVRAAFLPSSVGLSRQPDHLGKWQSSHEGMSAWLPFCVRNVSACHSSLAQLQLPSAALDSVRSLVGDLRFLCTTEVFKEAIAEIKTLHCNELWNHENDINIGRITSLPLLFENIVMETLHTLKEIASEGDLEHTEGSQRVRDKAAQLFTEMLQAFVECFQSLAFHQDQDQDRISVSSLSDTQSTYSLDDNTPAIDERLLIVLNNCRYVRLHVLPKLVESFRRHGYTIGDPLTQSLQGEFSQLENRIVDAYIEQKGESLVGGLEPGMCAGDFKWHDCLPPNDVRNYVKEAIMNLVMVHAQVFRVSIDLLPLVLSRLTDLLANEFKRLMEKIGKSKRKFMSAGAVTAHLEARAFQEALVAYLSPGARAAFLMALEEVPPLTKDSDKKLIEALMTSFKRKMGLQLQCFQIDMDEF
ncbi:exocyst complex component 2 isoform X2 [Nematostella vectensis]|uniref:exocyst complex component 2 isoform X2 n=1 Tax=Nematostella vectensis TaxID=45351 RepID=UPI0020770B0A|nr:exocyst complex component 2 isoform X2 [Nematostella vectensis]